MGDFFHGLEVVHRARALDGVHHAEYLVDFLDARRILLQCEYGAFHVVEHIVDFLDVLLLKLLYRRLLHWQVWLLGVDVNGNN